MKRDAAWLLRRYRDGGAPDWQVRLVLEREFNRLIEEQYELRAEVDELRRSAPERLRKFDEATDRALQWSAERRFEDTLKEIRRAAAELSELRRFVTVAGELDRASRAVREVESLLGSSLADLTTPGILRRLQSLARKLLDQGEARKARFVVFLLRHQLGLLQARSCGELKPGLQRMLNTLAARNGEAVEPIKELIRDGYHYLVERLVEDLDVDLAVRERSCRVSEVEGGSVFSMFEDVHAVRQRADSVKTSLTQWLESAS